MYGEITIPLTFTKEQIQDYLLDKNYTIEEVYYFNRNWKTWVNVAYKGIKPKFDTNEEVLKHSLKEVFTHEIISKLLKR